MAFEVARSMCAKISRTRKGLKPMQWGGQAHGGMDVRAAGGPFPPLAHVRNREIAHTSINRAVREPHLGVLACMHQRAWRMHPGT